MAKKDAPEMVETKPETEIDQKAVSASDKKEVAALEKKAEKIEEKIEVKTGERVNLVGDMGKPDSDDPKEWRDYLKKLDERLEKIEAKLESKSTEVPGAPETEIKKLPWYERELI